ncbi:MAG: NAD(P)-dependent oxidoreductase, partial [Saprospiraceae bacterium]|nr:NAD(P)-dependent oxidoreductase [Saprospiraceae bacterium]
LIETAINNNVKAFFNTDSFFNKPENYNYTYLKSYIFTKKHLEELLSLYSSKIKIINFKLEHLFGINDNPNKFTNRIIHQLINNERIELTSAEQKRDFIYCKDVAGLYEYAIHNLNLFDKITINVGTGNTISIKDFVLSAHHIIQSRAELLFGALKQREGEIMESHADLSYLKKIGWKPEYNFINALKETIQFEKKRLRII